MSLTELPESLGELKELKSLNLSSNRLRILPEWLAQLTWLEHLNLRRNQLTELPGWVGQLKNLRALALSDNQLTELPEWLGRLKGLRRLDVSGNLLTRLPESLKELKEVQVLKLEENKVRQLPEWLGQLTQLRTLDLRENQLTELPESLGQLTHLQSLYVSRNQLTVLPESLGNLTKLRHLFMYSTGLTKEPIQLGRLVNLESLLVDSPGGTLPGYVRQMRFLRRLRMTAAGLTDLPDWIGELTQLTALGLDDNSLRDIPASIAEIKSLTELDLRMNPLNPELAAAYKEGLDAVKRYLRAKAEAQVVLNEAKLILIGEGEVGKSCLLGALRGDPWEEGRPTTHGIEIKPLKVNDPNGKEITLNGWDFGGQRVYRPTHQLFFSAPAVYLVVWKPREGPQQGLVKEWIKLVKHREPDAKILVVATHGGPKQRQPDMDRQEIWDVFGKDTVLDFLLVESKPDEKTGEREGIAVLKKAIGAVAASLPEMGRKVPKRWEEARQSLKKTPAAYVALEQVLKLCENLNMDEGEARDFIRISHRLGHLIHYEHDQALQDVVVLKPDWLSTAISFVLDDKQTRENNGLVTLAGLNELWNDPERPEESRYPAKLHPVFLRLMERFDLSYRVAELQTGKPDGTSLIAQLVLDIRPDPIPGWSDYAAGDGQQVQICRIVEAKSGQSAAAEGLFYQLIVRLHKYSLGRVNYKESVHWQRGVVLDDDYNGRALLENLGNDVRITVRAPYPEAFLSVLTHEVKWLVESFWAGLRCDVMVPCQDPCGKNAPGTGLFEVQKLIESKRKKRPEYPCPICDEWQGIDCLLRNAPAARKATPEEFLAEFVTVKGELGAIRQQLLALHGEAVGRFDNLDDSAKRILSKVDDSFTGLMQAFTDEAKEGPRLFSFQPVDPGFFDRPKWVAENSASLCGASIPACH